MREAGRLPVDGPARAVLHNAVIESWHSTLEFELRALERAFNVVSTHLIGGLHEVRVFADSSPSEGFRPVDSSLEDVYFVNLARQATN